MDWSQHLNEVYHFLESKNKGLESTPEVVEALKDLETLWDNINLLESD